MLFRAFQFQKGLVVAQIAGAIGLFALLALTPPARGTILLIPVSVRARADLPLVALSHGASFVQRGPFPASLVVEGERTRLLPLAADGIIAVAGGAAGCRPKA